MVVETEMGEYMMEEDFGDVHSGASFVARAEIYPFQKTMVYHDQNRIITVGEGEVGDKIHGDLLEGVRAFGRNGGKWGNGGVSVDLVCLAGGTASDESADKGGHSGPPVSFWRREIM